MEIGVGNLIALFMVAAFLFPLYLFFSDDSKSEGKRPLDETIAEENRYKDDFVSIETSGTPPTHSETIQSTNVSLTEQSPASRESLRPEQSQRPEKLNRVAQKSDDDAEFVDNGNNWRCACEGGFLPPGMLQSFGSAEAVFRMSSGQCYHKQT